MHTWKLTSNHRRVVVGLLATFFVAIMMLLSSGTAATTTPKGGGAGAGHGLLAATPVAVEPAPPDPTATSAPAVSPSPAAVKTTKQLAPLPAPKAPTKTPAPPTATTLSKESKEAINLVEFWWDTFVLAVKESDGLKLTASQLRQPEVVVVKKATCKQPSTNMLGPKSRTSLTYCNGKLEFVPKVFMTITDPGKVKVVASGFLYHALATAPNEQLAGRSKMELLGYLQARLSYALVDYTATTHPEASWVVVHPVGSTHPDVNLGYVRGAEKFEN